MKSPNLLADRIWNAQVHRTRANRAKASVAFSAVLVASALAFVGLRPKEAIAFQTVVEATKNFRSVQWTQIDQGVIRQLDESINERVPSFNIQRGHFVSWQPYDIQCRYPEWKQWRGTTVYFKPIKYAHEGKIIKKTVEVHARREGPSKGLKEMDIRFALSSFQGLQGRLQLKAAGVDAEYNGKPAIKFDDEISTSKRRYRTTIIADRESKRMVHYRMWIFTPGGEKLYERELTDIRYNGPAPKN